MPYRFRPSCTAWLTSPGLLTSASSGITFASAAAVGSLGYLEVYATGPSPDAARRLANASADALIAEVRRSVSWSKR